MKTDLTARPGPTPELLQPIIRDRFLRLVASGNHIVAACCSVNVSYRTLRSLLTNAEKPDALAEYLEFLGIYRDADAEAEGNLYHRMVKAKDKSEWRKWAWILERRWPDKWGSTRKVEHSGKLDMTIGQAFLALPDTDDEEADQEPTALLREPA